MSEKGRKTVDRYRLFPSLRLLRKLASIAMSSLTTLRHGSFRWPWATEIHPIQFKSQIISSLVKEELPG